MQALVVYESMFGDGRLIAQSIAEGLAAEGVDATAMEVGQAPTDMADDLDLLIVGGPNHGFGLSRPETRAEARRRSGGEVVSERIGIREWLTELAPNHGHTRCVAWDTRLGHAGFRHDLDTSSHTIEVALQRAGYPSAASARHFLVLDILGPLVDGEPSRARAWGRQLAHAD